MRTVIVSTSRSPHANTRRIADAIAEVMDAQVISPAEAVPEILLEAQRVGFGSGIYNMSFGRALFDCVRNLPPMAGRHSFTFSTSGLPEPPLLRYTARFAGALRQAGFDVAGSFACRGWDTWGPFRLIGGVSKGRPSDGDFGETRTFADRLMHFERSGATSRHR